MTKEEQDVINEGGAEAEEQAQADEVESELEPIEPIEEVKPINELVFEAPGKDRLDKDDIERGLAKLPAMIANKANDVAQCRLAVDRAKITLKVAIARAIVDDSRTTKCSATDKKAFADKITVNQQQAVAQAEYELSLAEIILTSYENYYISVRKQAYFELAEWETKQPSISRKYGDNDR